MKKDKKKLHKQRQILDKKFQSLSQFKDLLARPRSGWLKVIRESLGISSSQLAKRLGGAQSSLMGVEERERTKKVSLETLQKTAEAMDCEFFYMILPKGKSLEEILDLRAQKASEKILSDVSHSMKLEDQGLSKKELESQMKELTKTLKESLDPSLWDKEND